MAVIVLMFRGGDRGLGLPPPPRVPPPTESVPCSCLFHGPGVGGGPSGGAAEESELPRPLQQAEMCAVPPPWMVDKLSSGREAGWSHAGPGHSGHSCCPSLPTGPPPPSPSWPLCSRACQGCRQGSASRVPPQPATRKLGIRVARGQPLLPRGTLELAATGRLPQQPLLYWPQSPRASQRPRPKTQEQVLEKPSCEASSSVGTQGGCRCCRSPWPHWPGGPSPGGRGGVSPLSQSWGSKGHVGPGRPAPKAGGGPRGRSPALALPGRAEGMPVRDGEEQGSEAGQGKARPRCP